MIQTIGHLPVGWLIFTILIAAGFIAFMAGRSRAVLLSDGGAQRLHSQPNYHGYFLAMATVVPAAIVLLSYLLFGEMAVQAALRAGLPDALANLPDAQLNQYIGSASDALASRTVPGNADTMFRNVMDTMLDMRGKLKLGALGLAVLVGGLSFLLARRGVSPDLRARNRVERGIQMALFLCAAIAITTTIGIVASLLFESLRFFAKIPVTDFLFGMKWNAQTNQDFGAIPLFFGTFMIALIAMTVAAPIGLLAAIYLSEYAGTRTRAWVKPVLEVLAGIPTVVYGFFALLVVAPFIRSVALWLNGLPFIPDTFFAASPSNALGAGLVMGVMIIPFVSSLSDDVINAVPQNLRDGAYAIGATKSETIKQVVMPAALPGVIAALLLAVSRAIGETMIVVMVNLQRATITPDPTADMTTITVQIVGLLTGDSEFDSAKTLSAFALGLTLFAVTLFFNMLALRVVKKFREKYE